MSPRELKRQLDLLFEADREHRQALADLTDRVHELECAEDFQDVSDFKEVTFDGVIEPNDDWQVYVTAPGGEREKLSPRLDLGHHSPDGFSWGYVGSGPSQLALGLLAEHLRHPEVVHDNVPLARKLAHAFMLQVVCKLPMNESWSMTSCDIDDWLSEMGAL